MKSMNCIMTLMAISITSMQTHALTFTINEKVSYQTIQGFGGMSYYSADVNETVGDLGINTVRFELSGLVTAEMGSKPEDLVKLKALKAGGVKYFIGTNWNLPAQFKDASSRVIPAQYGALADWIVSRVKNFKDNVGADPLAINIQNEPDLGPSQYYDASFLTSVDYPAIIKLLGPKLQTAGYTTKIFLTEGMVGNSGFHRGCLDAVMKDSIASKYILAYAVHGYGSNGITPASTQAQLWTSTSNNALRYNMPLWMTETSGYGNANQWTEAINFGKWLYAILKYGKLSRYVHHYLTLNGSHGADLAYFIEDGVKIPMFFAYKQFSKYIKEGAVQLQCTASDTSIPAPVVFADQSAKTITMVFINDGAAKTFNFVGTGLPSEFTEYLTTATDKCVSKGTIPNNASITLPANSIMTLVGAYTQQIVAVDHSRSVHVVSSPNARRQGTNDAYGITGRKIGARANAYGVYLTPRLGTRLNIGKQ